MLAVITSQANSVIKGSALNDLINFLPGTAAAPLFLVSAYNRDDLAASVSVAGWQVIAARRADGAERRFVASGAKIAVVDARANLEEGCAVTAVISNAVEANGSALLVLIDKINIDALDNLFAAGATHYLAEPFDDAELAQALRFAERFAHRLASGSDGLSPHLDIENDSTFAWQGHFDTGKARVSEALRKQLNLPTRDTTITELFDLMPEESKPASLMALRRLRANRKATAFTHMLPGIESGPVAHHLRIDETTDFVQGTIETPHAVGDAVERSARDPLTGLRTAKAARRWLDSRLNSTDGLYVILIALTEFEMINAAFGRDVGDSLLRAVARRIEPLIFEWAGRGAMIARIAGAEFAIGITGAMAADKLHLLTNQLVEVIERPFVSNEQAVTLGSRIGVVQASPSDTDTSIILRRASQALAEAKMMESGRIKMLIGEQAESALFDISLQSDLRSALDQDQIDVVFQPQVSVTSGEIMGVEALARWNHPIHGTLGAFTLFSVAEQSNYTVALSSHVQRRAAQIAARWPESLSGLRLSINVTAADIAMPSFVSNFLNMIDASGFPRDRLTVEITESGLMEDLSDAAGILSDLRAAGCRVAIDDFGTGYSSLAYLKALPLDYLKIDKGLAGDIEGSTRDRIVVRGVIDMARSLDLVVIAEGVESDAQLGLLAQEGCNIYQGFLCSEALDVPALDALVERWTSARNLS